MHIYANNEKNTMKHLPSKKHQETSRNIKKHQKHQVAQFAADFI